MQNHRVHPEESDSGLITARDREHQPLQGWVMCNSEPPLRLCQGRGGHGSSYPG